MKTRDLTQLLRLAIDERKDFCVEETELYLEEAEKSYPQIKVVTEHIIAKYCSSKRNAEHEYDITKKAFKAGVCVPHPCAVIAYQSKQETKWYFAMERAPGIRISELSKNKKAHSLELCKQEIDKILDLGIIPYDDPINLNEQNAVYNPKTDKICLIDVSLWDELSLRDEAAKLKIADYRANVKAELQRKRILYS